MNVIVDTSVWSQALRRVRQGNVAVSSELAELVREGRVLMLGAVRQELLSGIESRQQFELLRERLRAFPDVALERDDYEEAAEAFNGCREKGIQGSNTDFLICAAARRRNVSIFSTDGDFLHFARVLPIALHAQRA